MKRELETMNTEEIAFGLSKLKAAKRRYLFVKLSESEKSELKRLNREIKTYERYLKSRQIRMEGF